MFSFHLQQFSVLIYDYIHSFNCIRQSRLAPPDREKNMCVCLWRSSCVDFVIRPYRSPVTVRDYNFYLTHLSTVVIICTTCLTLMNYVFRRRCKLCVLCHSGDKLKTISTGRIGRPKNLNMISSRDKDCFPLQSDHAGSGIYAVSYPVVGTIPCAKTASAGSCTGRHFMLRFRSSGPIHLLTFWHHNLQLLKHKDSLTF